MGYNHHNDEITDSVLRMHSEWQPQKDAQATVARLSAKGAFTAAATRLNSARKP
jgi:hypothetical protein